MREIVETVRTATRRAPIASAIAGALTLTLAMWAGAERVADPDALGDVRGVAVGAPVPDFTLPDETGAEHQLSSYRGKAVVLEWTNQECPFVRRHYDADTMEKLARALGAREVVWLAVNSTRDNTPAETVAWREQQGFEYATLQDPAGKVGRMLGARTTPHMFVVDVTGRLRYAGAIDDDPRGRADAPQNYVNGAVHALLGGGDPDPARTEPYGCSVKYASE